MIKSEHINKGNGMKHIVALSGGKDSTAMALRLKELYPNREFEYILTPTGDELPEMNAHWDRLTDLLNSPLKKINDPDLFELIDRHKMIPNFRARFCTSELKIKPFLKYMSEMGPDAVMYVGLRSDEGQRLGIIDTEVNVEYPMKGWGWGINEVNRYLNGFTILKCEDREQLLPKSYHWFICKPSCTF